MAPLAVFQSLCLEVMVSVGIAAVGIYSPRDSLYQRRSLAKMISYSRYVLSLQGRESSGLPKSILCQSGDVNAGYRDLNQKTVCRHHGSHLENCVWRGLTLRSSFPKGSGFCTNGMMEIRRSAGSDHYWSLHTRPRQPSKVRDGAEPLGLHPVPKPNHASTRLAERGQ